MDVHLQGIKSKYRHTCKFVFTSTMLIVRLLHIQRFILVPTYLISPPFFQRRFLFQLPLFQWFLFRLPFFQRLILQLLVYTHFPSSRLYRRTKTRVKRIHAMRCVNVFGGFLSNGSESKLGSSNVKLRHSYTGSLS